MTKAQNLNEFKEWVGETVKQLEDSLWTDKFKNDLFRSLIKTPEYQELRKVFLDNKKTEREKEALFQESFVNAKKLNPEINEENFREMIMWKSESSEEKNTDESLLNKENMTSEDKENMKKSIDQLKRQWIDTGENMKKLNAIIYHANAIEIWWVKRARENLTAAENKNKWIYNHEVNGKERTYFKRKAWMEEVEKQWMKLPTDTQMETSLKALPWGYERKNNWKEWWNIMWTILWLWDLPGSCDGYGDIDYEGKYGYLWSSSEHDEDSACHFVFNEDKGILDQDHVSTAFVCRPVIK